MDKLIAILSAIVLCTLGVLFGALFGHYLGIVTTSEAEVVTWIFVSVTALLGVCAGIQDSFITLDRNIK